MEFKNPWSRFFLNNTAKNNGSLLSKNRKAIGFSENPTIPPPQYWAKIGLYFLLLLDICIFKFPGKFLQKYAKQIHITYT